MPSEQQVVVAFEQQVSISKRFAKQKRLQYFWVALLQKGARGHGVEHLKRKKEAEDGSQMEAEGVPVLRWGWGV